MSFFYPLLTIVLFVTAQLLQQRFPTPLLNPVLVTLVTLLLLLATSGISYQSYNQYSQWLSDLLQPAVVALGVPLYQQLRQIRRSLVAIVPITLIAVAIALSSTVLLSLLIGASEEIAISLAPKAVTTPIAVLISDAAGGVEALTAIAVIIAGLVGAVIGEKWLSLCGVTSSPARGMAMGVASHALGTAQISRSDQVAGAYSALALVLSAIFSALLCPLILPLIL